MATAFTLGIGAAVLSWYFIGSLQFIYATNSLGLVPPVASGLIGGVVTAAITS